MTRTVLYASLLCCLLFCSISVSALPEGWTALPPWLTADNETGTFCYCGLLTSEYSTQIYGACPTIRGENNFVDPMGNYTCDCHGLSIHCGINEEFVSLDLINGTNACFELGVDETEAFDADLPDCVDTFGNTCGGLAGIRTAVKKELLVTEFGVDLDNGSSITVIGEECRLTTVRSTCVTPLCNAPPVDCEEELEFSQWSSCYAFQDSCVKTRAKEIRVNASNGGLPCRSLEDRSETANCTVEECQRQQCTYELLTVIGNCTDACGESTRNTTVYNISVTPLSICSQGLESVVSQSESSCRSLPCDENSLPINITCETRGHQGYRNSSVKYVVVSLGGLPVSTNHTNASLGVHLTIEYALSGRPMPYDFNGVIYTANEVLFPLKTSDKDYARNTGATFRVRYISPEKTTHTLFADDQPMPSFTCLTVDKVRPVLTRVIRPTSESLSFYLDFSESVYWTTPSSPPIYTEVLRFNNFVNLDPNPMVASFSIISPSMASPYLFPIDPLQLIVPANASIQLKTEFLVDMSGNLAIANHTLIPIHTFSGSDDNYSILPPTASETLKLFSNNSRGIPDSVYLSLAFPFNKADAQTYVSDFKLKTLVTRNDSTAFTITSPGVAVYFEDVWNDPVYPNERSSDVIVQFATDDPLINALYNQTDRSAFSLSYSIIIPESVANDEVTTDIGGESGRVFGGEAQITEFEPPRVLSVRGRPNDAMLCFNFSSSKSGLRPFVLSDFLYRGNNSFTAVFNQTAISACLNLSYELSFSSFSTDRVVFVDSMSPGMPPPVTEHPIDSILGPLPRVLSAVVLNTRGGNTWDRLVLTLDMKIGGRDSTDVRDLVYFTWSNPTIQSIVPTSILVSQATATINVQVTCIDVCYDTGSNLRVTVAGFYSEAGAPMHPSVNLQVADLARPRLVSAIRINRDEYTFTTSEPLEDSVTGEMWKQVLNVDPLHCVMLADNELIVVLASKMKGSTVVTSEGSFVVDKSGNYMQMTDTNTAKYLRESDQCGSFFDLHLAVTITVSTFVVAGVLWLLYRMSYAAKFCRALSTGK